MRKPQTALLRKCDKCGKRQNPVKVEKNWIHYGPNKTCECGGRFCYQQVPYSEYEDFISTIKVG